MAISPSEPEVRHQGREIKTSRAITPTKTVFADDRRFVPRDLLASSGHMSTRMGGTASAHQNTPRTAKRPRAKKTPSETSAGHGGNSHARWPKRSRPAGSTTTAPGDDRGRRRATPSGRRERDPGAGGAGWPPAATRQTRRS